MDTPTKPPGPFSIGSDLWPGLSKLVEECGETLQVCGKLIGTGGAVDHWDGSDLRARLVLELADLSAAIAFFTQENYLDGLVYVERTRAKLEQFKAWHTEQKKQ